MNRKLKKIKDYRYENNKKSKWLSILKISKFIPNILYKNQLFKNYGKYFARKIIENNKNQILKKFDF